MRAWYNDSVKIALSLLAAALAVAASTGCSEDKQAGTSTGAGTGATTSLSVRPKPAAGQSRWAQQVDAACKPWQQRIDAVSAPPADVAALRRWLERVLPLVRQQIAAVEKIKPPAKPAEARRVRLFLDSVHKTERALTRYLRAIRANEPAKVRSALADAGASGAAARAYAVSLGVTQCGGYASG